MHLLAIRHLIPKWTKGIAHRLFSDHSSETIDYIPWRKPYASSARSMATGQRAIAANPRVCVYLNRQPAILLDQVMLNAMPRAAVLASARHEPISQWGGVALLDIVRRAAASVGHRLRSRATTTIIGITASDGFEVIFSLLELDESNGDIILADTKNGHPIANSGAYRVIAPNDLRPTRWIQDVIAIDILDTSVALH
jgi:hypothetical protein